MRTTKTLGVVLALCLGPASLLADNYVFVFHGSSNNASVYNADTMAPVGTPNVGPDARRAFGIPDPSNPGQFTKIYVVTGTQIVVLNPVPPFSIRTVLPLTGPLASGPNAAVLSGDARKLLVAAGSQVHVVDTTSNDSAFAATLGTVANPIGIAVVPHSRRAYVISSGSSIIQIIDLAFTPPQILSTQVLIPTSVPAVAIGMAPNGSRVYVSTAGAIYEIDRVSNLTATAITNSFQTATSFTFDPDPPVRSAVLNNGGSAPVLDLPSRTMGSNPLVPPSLLNISEIVTPGGNRAYLLASGRLFQGFLSAGGTAFEVMNPQTAQPFGSTGVDIETSPDGRALFAAFSGETRLVRIDPSGSVFPAQVVTSSSPTGISLVYAPGAQPGVVEIYGGNNQSAPSNTTFPTPLAVRVRASNPHPVFNQTVSFSSTTEGVTFSEQNPVTNLSGVAETFLQASVSTPFTVVASITSGGFTQTQTFNLNGGLASAEGLSIFAGDRQITSAGGAFPVDFVVRAVNFGAPAVGLTLTITSSSSVSCSSTAITDANGLAAFPCTAAVVGLKTTAEISVSDSLGRSLPEPFRVTIVPSASDLPTMIVVENEEALVGVVRQTIQEALRVRVAKSDGLGVEDVGVSFTSQQDVSFNPRIGVSSSSGRATAAVTFGCFVGTGRIRATALAPGTPSADIPFMTSRGPAARMIKSQGDNQSGNPGQRLPLAAKVKVGDICDNGIPGQSVAWSVNPPGAATLENIISTTDLDGQSSVLVRLGNRAGSFTVTAVSGSLSATFTMSVNIVASRLTLVSGNNQTVAVGQTAEAALLVEVTDDNGVATSGVEVNFSVTVGSATLLFSRVITDAAGRASNRVTAGSTLGAITVLATAVGRSVTFNLTVVGRVPVVSSLGFVNSASFRVGWVPGSGGTIFGVGLMEGITGSVFADRAPFPTSLRGVRVVVEGIEAPMISMANIGGTEQLNIQVPTEITAPRTVTVVIHNNGSSATFTGVPVFAVQPGIFEINSGGVRTAAALHLEDFSVVTPSNPARPGQIILLFLTGLGLTRPAIATNVAGPVPPPETLVSPIVGINDEGTEMLGSFYAPTLYTAYQINFRIPANAAAGLAKLSVVAGGVASQDSRIPIGP